MRHFLFLIFIACGFISDAQNKNSLKAIEYYNRGNYLRALDYFNKLDNVDLSIEIKKKIVNCYRLTNNLIQSESYLKSICDETNDELYCQYYLDVLIRKKDLTTIEYLTNKGLFKINISELKNVLATLYNDRENYVITPLDLNSRYADMSIVKYKNGFVYCSSIPIQSTYERTHNWTNQPFIKLLYSECNNDKWTSPIIFSKEINCKYNVGPLCFCNKGKEIWVTENYATPKDNSTEHKFKLKLASYKLLDDKWIKQKDFSFNNIDFNVAHPAISEDGNTLYFSSNLPGGFGGMDIYVCHKTKKGWSNPINLGGNINTSGNEIFPTLLSDGTIYFSSDGLLGLGGLDLFYTKLVNENYLTPINIGAPVNSIDDDFYLTYDVKNQCGYFTSNRINKGFDDDIFKFIKTKTNLESTFNNINNDAINTHPTSKEVSNLNKKVITINDKESVIAGAQIFDSQNQLIGQTNENGIALIDSGIKKIKVIKDGYYSKEIIFNEIKNNYSVTMKPNTGIANANWYKIIYYDLDKCDIRKDMMNDMKEVVSFVNAHPEIKITITSFTDSRASVNYNAKLSQKRTESIESYLLLHGVSKKQIAMSEWKGEGILVNDCGDTTPCTESMHQLNRRTEIFISGLIK
ncbi:MAG: OmpA family protein [Bacteroidota bacterium]